MSKNDSESGFISHLVELRKRLINSRKLKAVKTGESQQSAMRITKDSVIDLISKLELEAVHQCDDCPEKD